MKQVNICLDSYELNNGAKERGLDFHEGDNLAITLENSIDKELLESVPFTGILNKDTERDTTKCLKAKEFIFILSKIIDEEIM